MLKKTEDKLIKKVIKEKIKTVKTRDIKTKKTVKKSIPKKAKVITKKEDMVVKYVGAVGRRKTAVARVRLYTKGKKDILVNDKDYQLYFPDLEMQKTILQPLEVMNSEDKFSVSVRVKGGGLHSQAGAIKHGLARTLVKFNPEFRKRLKKLGFLTRDPRMRERKKFGLKRARRGPQWSKR